MSSKSRKSYIDILKAGFKNKMSLVKVPVVTNPDLDEFISIFKKYQDTAIRMPAKQLYFLVDYLKNHHYFAKISETIGIHGIQQLLLSSKVAEYPKNTIIFNKGDPADFFYIIVDGSVGVYMHTLSKARDFGETTSVLSQGESFGDIALIKKSMRTASISTLTSTVLLKLPIETYKELLSDHQVMAIRKITDRLKEFFIFKEFGQQLLNLIYYATEIITFKKDEVAFREGEAAKGVFFIYDGSFKITKLAGADLRKSFEDSQLTCLKRINELYSDVLLRNSVKALKDLRIVEQAIENDTGRVVTKRKMNEIIVVS